jgi:hypothetical protein
MEMEGFTPDKKLVHTPTKTIGINVEETSKDLSVEREGNEVINTEAVKKRFDD